MTPVQLQYYKDMKTKERLIPLFDDDKLRGLITFYVGNSQEDRRYIRTNMWSVLNDNPKGDTVFIDQCIMKEGRKYQPLAIWHFIKKYLKKKFPNVKHIKWNRLKRDRVKRYNKEV